MLVPGGQYKGPLLLQSAAGATGNGTAVDCIENDNGAFTVLGLQVKGITSATITWEGTIDGTNWAAVMVEPLATGTEATTTTADGLFRANVLGLLKFRARISAWASGTITVTGFAVA